MRLVGTGRLSPEVEGWIAQLTEEQKDPEGEPLRPGDLNCDGVLNAFDIDPFILALFDPDAYDATYPHCDLMRADLNADGRIDALDIEPFIDELFGS